MKIFLIDHDANNYHWLAPDVTGEDLLRLVTFDCTPRESSWRPPYVTILDAKTKMGDFLNYNPSALLVSPDALPLIRHFFERAGELLPLWFNGDQYTLLNVTECINALDDPKTDWLLADDGSKVEIRRHMFDATKLTDSSIFKIPETRRGDVLTWERDCDPKTEFKAFVEENGLTGLIFKEIWNSEDEDLKGSK